MLVIPAIEIENHRCIRTVISDPSDARSVYPSDPAEMALLWRKENAKTLHVSDYGALYGGKMENFDEIVSIVRQVEIPIEVMSRCSSVEECAQWLDAGVYRLVVHDLILHDPEGVKNLLGSYGPSRLSAGAITREGKLCDTWREVEKLDAVEFAARAKSLGFRRLFFTDRDYVGVLRGPNFDQLHRVATEAKMPITAAGGVATVEHLWRLQSMEPLGIDAVVIGRAFYEDRFPCQQLWRDVEYERMQKGAESEEVSTSRLAGEKGG